MPPNAPPVRQRSAVDVISVKAAVADPWLQEGLVCLVSPRYIFGHPTKQDVNSLGFCYGKIYDHCFRCVFACLQLVLPLCFSESNFGVAGADRFWSTLLAGSSSLRMSKSKPL